MISILSPHTLGKTGLHVSGAGFGSYRVSVGVEMHRQALRAALASGINLIDTSANYADGGSEELIGSVIAEMIEEGVLERKDVVVVSKGGYIQGTNYKLALDRLERGSGFPEVVEYADGLWHCIAPEFLDDQITRSLNRLAMPKLDVFLLHNPEYFLNAAKREGMLLDEARMEYYRRIGEAFRFLEEEVERGRIGWYGISSNSFPHPADEYDATSLEECIRIAENISLIHHFAVIQFPANLLEHGFATENNQSGQRTLMQVAREKNMGVLINRPLNAITGSALQRLADFPLASEQINAAGITAQIDMLIAEERKFSMAMLEELAHDEESKRALKEFVAVGLTLQRYWNTFETIEQYNDVLSQYFAPRLGFVSQYIVEHGSDSDKHWYVGYAENARKLLRSVGIWYSNAAQKRSDQLRQRLASALGFDELHATLSQLAIRALLGVPGVSSVLVGMRREEYVSDVCAAIQEGGIGDEDLWSKLATNG